MMLLVDTLAEFPRGRVQTPDTGGSVSQPRAHSHSLAGGRSLRCPHQRFGAYFFTALVKKYAPDRKNRCR